MKGLNSSLSQNVANLQSPGEVCKSVNPRVKAAELLELGSRSCRVSLSSLDSQNREQLCSVLLSSPPETDARGEDISLETPIARGTSVKWAGFQR